MSNLTPWFPPGVNPVHVGVYNASALKDKRVLRFWNGKYWSKDFSDRDSEVFVAHAKARASYWIAEIIYWRGLAVQPEGSKP